MWEQNPCSFTNQTGKLITIHPRRTTILWRISTEHDHDIDITQELKDRIQLILNEYRMMEYLDPLHQIESNLIILKKEDYLAIQMTNVSSYAGKIWLWRKIFELMWADDMIFQHIEIQEKSDMTPLIGVITHEQEVTAEIVLELLKAKIYDLKQEGLVIHETAIIPTATLDPSFNILYQVTIPTQGAGAEVQAPQQAQAQIPKTKGQINARIAAIQKKVKAKKTVQPTASQPTIQEAMNTVQQSSTQATSPRPGTSGENVPQTSSSLNTKTAANTTTSSGKKRPREEIEPEQEDQSLTGLMQHLRESKRLMSQHRPLEIEGTLFYTVSAKVTMDTVSLEMQEITEL